MNETQCSSGVQGHGVAAQQHPATVSAHKVSDHCPGSGRRFDEASPGKHFGLLIQVVSLGHHAGSTPGLAACTYTGTLRTGATIDLHPEHVWMTGSDCCHPHH